jgi:hypothetical protein
MRKTVLLTIIFALAALLAYRLFSNKTPTPAEKKDQPLQIGKNSNAFDTAFAGVLGAYYSLSEALVEWDSVKADRQAYLIAQKADSLPFKELKADSVIVLTARSLAASIVGEAKGFMGESDRQQKTRAFNMLTDELYNLVRTVRYDGQIIYHARCPMAFGDSAEGYWLTNTNKIINPYLGKKHPVYGGKMIGCGEVSDSLDFSK